MYAYPATIPQLTEFAGTPVQYPVYSAAAAGLFYVAAPALLGSFRGESGRTIIERGLDDRRVPALLRPALRVLTFVGFMNVMAVSYGAVLILGAVLGGPAPARIPSYLRNGLL